jgi:hypothetical protein
VTARPDDADALATVLAGAVARGDALDAFLAAAGLLQVAEDALDSDPALLLHAAERLASGGPAGRAGAAAARAVAHRAGAMAARRRPAALRAWTAAMGDAAALLAGCVVAGAPPDGERIAAAVAAVRTGLALLPAPLRVTTARRPACFSVFDQHPDDVCALVARFARVHPERGRPLLVAGVRTSGAYLGPLAVAALREAGYEDVRGITLRPGRRLRGDQAAAVRAVARRGGVALVCDDPPATGRAVGAVADELARRGLRVVLLLAVLEDAEVLPPRLRGHTSVLLPEAEWAVRARLAPAAVAHALRGLAGPRVDVLSCAALTGPAREPARGHVRGVYEVGLRFTSAGSQHTMAVAAEGAGLGRFGARALDVHRSLAPFLPVVLGLRDGVIYREWLPADRRVGRTAAGDRDALAARLARYVDARARALALPRDETEDARGERPAWELAGLLLAGAFGPAEPAARVLVVDPAVRRVLRVARPAETDGRMELSRWYARPGGELVKVDWAEPADASWRVASCDPVSDLAQVTARSQDRALARGLRRAYAATGREPIEPERWLLHELAHLWSERPAADGGDPALLAACARAMRAYYEEVFFAGLEAAAEGPLCGLDVDGVLELDVLGFPALTPASAAALRALLVHGWRPLLVSGRGAGEIAERCASYRLPGGVAEYGAALHVTAAGATSGLLAADEVATLERVRAALAAQGGVRLDPGHRHALRAYVVDAGGRRRPPPDTAIAAALHAAAAAGVRVIRGDGQTDLVPAAANKGDGVRALLARLGADAGAPHPLDLAVGDTVADVPLLRLARRPFVPAHAPRELRAALRTTRAAYAAGLAEAVGAVLGHAPGGCPACRIADGGESRRTVLALLGLREGGLQRLPVHALGVLRAR